MVWRARVGFFALLRMTDIAWDDRGLLGMTDGGVGLRFSCWCLVVYAGAHALEDKTLSLR